MSNLIYIGERNKDRYVYTHNQYNNEQEDFSWGFHEAIDFFMYINCYFSIAAAHKIWSPESEWDKEHAVVDGVLVHNHFWEKFVNKGRSPFLFYDSLDICNKQRLYSWYKTNVKK